MWISFECKLGGKVDQFWMQINNKRTKGDKHELEEIDRIKTQQVKHVAAAKEAVEEEFHGANQWLQSHQELLSGCELALAIEDNDSIEIGEKVQVFPNGNNGCEAA